MNGSRKAALAALSLSVAAPAWAGSIDDPICADRPGKGSATCTVPKGHWQVETGIADWSLSKDGDQRDTELDIGDTIVKYGLTDRLDIEVEVVPLVRLTSSNPLGRTSVSGFGDMLIHVKRELGSGQGPLSAALYPFVKLPTARRAIGNGRVEGGVILPLGYQLGNSPFSISASPELDLNANAAGGGYHLAMAQVIGLGWQASKALNLSAELWGGWDWDPSGTTRQTSADIAAAYVVGGNVQLDAGANFGLDSATPDVEYYGGVSIRF